MNDRSGAKAFADIGAGVILARVDIASSPERVFRALTNPQEITQWWGSCESYRTESWTADLRVGGAWKAEGRGADGAPFTVSGKFLEFDPPHKLVKTWKPDWDGGHETVVTYQLDATDAGTRVTVRHEGFVGRAASCEQHSAGWESVLGWLSGYLQSSRSMA